VIALNSKRFRYTLLFLCISGLLASCHLSKKESESQVTSDLNQWVASTLQSFDVQRIQTATFSFRETADRQSMAVEVTQSAVTPSPSPLNSPEELPEEHYIWNIWGHRQFYAIGCEAAAVQDWARYFGVDIHEANFQFQLPVSDNPDYGFVGVVTNPWGQIPPYSYGVHAYPMANLLRSNYGIPARGLKGFSLEQLRAEISANRPVIAWVIGNVVGGVPYEYVDQVGRKVIVAAYQHTVIVTGFTASTIRYMNNGRFYDIPTEVFENSWAVLGNMVVIWEG